MLVADNHAFATVTGGAFDKHPVVASRCLTALALTMMDIEDVTPKTARYRNAIRSRFWGTAQQLEAETNGWGLFYTNNEALGQDVFRLQAHGKIFADDDEAITYITAKLARGDCLLELRALCYLAACHDPSGGVNEEPVITPEQRLVAQELEQSLLCAQRMGLLDSLRPMDGAKGETIDRFISLVDRFTTDNPIYF